MAVVTRAMVVQLVVAHHSLAVLGAGSETVKAVAEIGEAAKLAAPVAAVEVAVEQLAA